ncbi:MAG: alpha/beta fold hydrolase [Alphaproteobacteria bacterium]
MTQIIEKSITVDGLNIAYTVIGEGNAKPIFFAHGLLSNGRDYDALGTALAIKGYRCIAIDLPGRGKSDCFNNPKLYKPLNYIPHCLAVINAEIGNAPFDWFGVSLGGIIGMGLCSAPNVNIKRLILGDIGAQIPRKGLNAVSHLAKTSPIFDTKDTAIRFLKLRCSHWGITKDETWDHLIAHNIVQNDDKYIMHYDPAIGGSLARYNITVKLWHIWKKIKQPVLLLRGESSILLPAKIAKKMEKKYTGENFKEITFENCGHVPNLMEKAQIQRVLEHF